MISTAYIVNVIRFIVMVLVVCVGFKAGIFSGETSSFTSN